MAFWNPDKIRYMEDAAAQIPFSEQLASQASAFLPRDSIVCDAGCGLGFLSIALAPYCREVIAADNDDAVLAVLRRHLTQRPVANVTPVCCDIFDLPIDVKYDAMVFCFFGSIAETLACAKKNCRGPVIMFKKDWHNHRFSLTDVPIEKIRHHDSESELKALGIPYQSKSFSVDMGQPLRSLDDALAFFRLYERGNDAIVTMEQIKQRLIEVDSREFPYYLPAVRNVGMIVVNASDIPDTQNLEVSL